MAILLYVTTDIRIPSSDVVETIEDYRNNNPNDNEQPRICWVSWRVLLSLFNDSGQKCLRDIGQLMSRMNLNFYSGISPVTPIDSIKWHFEMSD